MEKISFGSLSKTRKIVVVLNFCVFLTILSIVWGVISAQDVPFSTETILDTSTSTIPLAPTDLILTSTTMPPVNLIWVDNANNEDKFNIERKLSSTSTWSTLTQIQQSDTTTYIDTTALSGMTYDYRVQACLSGTGCSEYVYLNEISIPSDIPVAVSSVVSCSLNVSIASNAPATQSVSLGQTGVSLVKFNLLSNCAINLNSFAVSLLPMPNGYLNISSLRLYKDGVQIGSTINNPPAGANFQNLNMTMSDDQTVIFEVKGDISTSAIAGSTVYGVFGGSYATSTSGSVGNNASGNIIAGNTMMIASEVTASDTTIPSTPSNVVATKDIYNEVDLSWTPSTDNVGVVGYEVWRTTAGFWGKLGDVTVPSFVDTSVLASTPYYYRIVAYDRAGNKSALSLSLFLNTPAVTTTTLPTSSDSTNLNNSTILTMPLAPTNFLLDGITIPRYISLIWKDNANNEDKFIIERKLNNTSTWTTLAQVGTNIVHYIDNKVLPGLYYDYRIAACLSGIGCSNYAVLSKVITTIPTIPTTPITPTTPIIPITPTTPTTLITPTQQTIPAQQITPITPAISTTPIMPTTPTTLATPNTTVTSITPTNTISLLPPLTTTQINTQTSSTKTEVSTQIEDLGVFVEERKTAIDNSKEQLVKIINNNVEVIIKDLNKKKQKINLDKIYALQNKLLSKIDSSLKVLTYVTPVDINNLKTEINKGIDDIKLIASENITIVQDAENISSKNVTDTLNTLATTVNTQSETLNNKGGDLLYRDSNKDGISDYESVYVYKMNPVEASPVSTYEGKNINASEKVLLGFDPTQSEMVKVEKEQPVESPAPIIDTYKVKEIILTKEKEVVLKGQALPNSFVTIYIYSTPIVVTVKTNSDGEWQYTLDKELEDGDHTVYTATVNNSGNIVAKSSPYLFTKTAEAATLKDFPISEASENNNKPGLLEGNSLYVIVLVIIFAVIIILILVGITVKKNKEKSNPNS